jgi:hypothetical protein
MSALVCIGTHLVCSANKHQLSYMHVLYIQYVLCISDQGEHSSSRQHYSKASGSDTQCELYVWLQAAAVRGPQCKDTYYLCTTDGT